MSQTHQNADILNRIHIQKLVSRLTFLALVLTLLPNLAASAESCKDILKTAASLNDKAWNFSETTFNWREMNEKGQTIFYASAGLTRAGVLHFNLKFV